VIVLLRSDLQQSLTHLETARDELAAANATLQSKLVEIEDLAYFNSVTGLPNKNRFKEQVENLISDPDVDHFCFLLLDLDDFKEVNEAFGHVMGDQVLQKTARRLGGADTNCPVQVFNLGSDEFACLFIRRVDSAVCPDSALMLERIAKPLVIEDHVFNLSACGGIVSYPEHGATFDELFKNADTALYHAKSIQRGIAIRYIPLSGRLWLPRHGCSTIYVKPWPVKNLNCITSHRLRPGQGPFVVSRRWCAGTGRGTAWSHHLLSSRLLKKVN